LPRSFSPFCTRASGSGSAPSARANHTALVLSALGMPLGLGTPVLPSPDSATHFVNSARIGSLTAWPRSLASRLDQITRLAWWQEAQLCFCFQASASLVKKATPRLIVPLTSRAGSAARAPIGSITRGRMAERQRTADPLVRTARVEREAGGGWAVN